MIKTRTDDFIAEIRNWLSVNIAQGDFVKLNIKVTDQVTKGVSSIIIEKKI